MGDVRSLVDAEREYLQAGEVMTQAIQKAPGYFGRIEIGPMVEATSSMARNLRRVCERMLRPSRIVVSALPRFLFAALIAAGVILVAQGTAGLDEGSDRNVMLVVVTSLVLGVLVSVGFDLIWPLLPRRKRK